MEQEQSGRGSRSVQSAAAHLVDGSKAANHYEQDWQRQRKAILDAARQLLQKRCYDDITLEDIARMSRVPLEALFLHFNNKGDAYAAAVDDELDMLLHLLSDSYDSRASPLVNLLAALDVGIELDNDSHWQDKLPIFRSISFAKGFPPHFSLLFDEKIGRAAAHLKRILDEGVAQRHFRPMDTGRVAVLHLTMAQGYIQALLLTRHAFKQEHDPAEDFQEVRRSFQELVAGGVLAPPLTAQNYLITAQTRSAALHITSKEKLSCLLPKP